MDRRRFLEVGGLAAASVSLGCFRSPSEPSEGEAQGGRLTVTWRAPSDSLAPGEHPLGLAGGRDGFIRVPTGHDPATPAPLALLLHGAGQSAREWEGGFPLFDELGLVVLSVDSRRSSWDVRYGAFGADVAFIDAALGRTFQRCNVDPARMAVAGFSDGASYALSLGLTNGDLFTRVGAFSPGFLVTDGRLGRPPVFLSHGAADPVLPVQFTRGLAGRLRHEGHEVRYEEFSGGHALPLAVGETGFAWLVGGP